MLTKVKAIIGLVIVSAVVGGASALSGVDWETAFGPTAGAAIAGVVAFSIREGLPSLKKYLSDQFGVEVPDDA